jgi:hypothetical protein
VGIPVRAGIFRDQQLQPQLDGTPLTSTGATFGVGILLRRLSVDLAIVNQTVAGKLLASIATSTATTPSTQSLISAERAESSFRRVLLSTTLRF